MMLRFMFATVAVVAPMVATAQISLSDYRDLVVEYSHTLQRAEAVVEGADADLQLAKRGFLPALSLSSDADYDFRGRGAERDVRWSVRADVVQPLFSGGGVRARSSRAEMARSVALGECEGAMLDVLYDAEVAYWNLSRAEIYYNAIAEYRTIVESLRNVAQHRYDEGYTSKSDLLQVESRLSDAEYQLSLAQQQRQQALHRFNSLCGAEPTREVSLTESILDTMYMPRRENVDEVIASHPMYVTNVARREVARWDIRVRRADYLPSVGLNIYGGWQPNLPYVKGAGTRLDGGAVVTMSTPIFHFGERREAVRSAQSKLRSAEVAVEDLADEIRLNESNGWTNLLATQERVEAIRRNLAIATENLEISTYSYGEGLATMLDVMQAQLSWLQIYSNAIAAQYDYAVAISAYRYIVAK